MAVILILLGTFAALGFGVIVVGVIAWQLHANRSAPEPAPREAVAYAPSAPPSYDSPMNLPPAAAPQPFPNESFAPVIDEGVPVTEAAPAASSPPPVGIRLELAAAVNSEQTIVYLNDVTPLVGVRLPVTIRIGDEAMNVTALDEFRTAITVERGEGVYHSVSSPVEVVQTP